MSDDDFMYDDAGEDYDFEYEDDDQELGDDSGEGVSLENQYYTAKGRKEDDPAGSIAEFERVIEIETEPGEWGFKALKQMCKVSFSLARFPEALDYYKRLLKHSTAVTKNYSEKSISNILDYMSSTSDLAFLETLYSATLNEDSLQNERLSIKAQLKLAKLYLDRQEYAKMMKIIRTLRQQCQQEDGSLDVGRRGTNLLEIYALEIQMYTETKNNKKLKELYQQCLSVKAAIPHPRIMGIVYECGAKMHMRQKHWESAQQDFFESFKNYDEAGSPQRIACLKYLVLANMLSESKVNPFDSQETKPYKNDPQILALTNLISAYQRKEIWEFERILNANRASIMEDAFIRDYINDVLVNIRTQVLLQLIKAYSTVDITFISTQLGQGVTKDEVEHILTLLILDNRVKGFIDQPAGKFICQPEPSESDSVETRKHQALLKLANHLSTFHFDH